MSSNLHSILNYLKMKRKQSIATAILSTGLFAVCITTGTSLAVSQSSQVNKETFDASKLVYNISVAYTDKEFFLEVAEFHQAEIQLGQLAQMNTSNSEVVALGKTLVSSHTQALKEVTDLAKRKNVIVPESFSENDKNHYNKLSEKTGNDFDVAYSKRIKEDHEHAIELFEKSAKESNDSDVKAWSICSLPMLKKHMESAKQCQSKCEASK